MPTVAQIVDRILETGEADQDYPHAPFDQIVNALEREGYPGAHHKEFDKYQGIYLRIPGCNKFWVMDWNEDAISLSPENDTGAETEAELLVKADDHGADISELVDYLERKGYAAKLAHARAQADAETFIDQRLQAGLRPTRPKG